MLPNMTRGPTPPAARIKYISLKKNLTVLTTSSTCSKGVCAHCKGALSTHFSRPVVRDAILTRAPLSVHTHARPPSHIQGPGVQDQAAAVHILRSPDFFRRINKKRPRSVRPSLFVFIVVWKTFLGMIENCRRRFDADSLKGKWWSREGGGLFTLRRTLLLGVGVPTRKNRPWLLNLLLFNFV